jgi:hypothetical protein
MGLSGEKVVYFGQKPLKIGLDLCTRGDLHRPMLQPAHRHRLTQLQLGNELLASAIAAEVGLDPQAPLGMDLGRRICAISVCSTRDRSF